MAWLPSEATRTITVVTAVTSVTISSDKAVYKVGDVASFSGYVRDSEGRGIADKLVIITIDSPYPGYEIGRTRTDTEGYWEVSWTIPWDVYWEGAYRKVPGTKYTMKAESEGVSGTVTITIAWETRISISAPSSVKEGESFMISGILEYEDLNMETLVPEWYPLGYQTVSIYYNDTLIGTARTDPETGAYSISASIPTIGSYTLKAVFEGSGVTLGALITRGIIVGIPISEIMTIALPLGIGLISIIVSKEVR